MDNSQPTTAPEEATSQVELVDISHFAKLDLRVAQIESAEAIPKSKKLLKLSVNLGERLGKRQILAGIAQFYTPDTLVGKKIAIIANLKPALLMGNESQGMLLAASSADGSMLRLVDPGQDMELGAQVR